MTRKYRHISDYEKEIIKMYEQGMSLRRIGERLGFTLKEMRDFKTRYNKKQRMIEAEKSLHKKGRPCKKEGELPPSIQKLDKLSQMRYVMASKDRYIKRLEMENELMRDFLLLTERK
ncbi:MAG: helix-turn-helix domain-containing protein [Oscillospiraceae bacterium]|nr:helix-turn-helix domain-containing protein [Eubacteriales bacterium]MDD6355308.1 helix-turn-helix domain-containing protein [Oscillospiraceae bacterium]